MHMDLKTKRMSFFTQSTAPGWNWARAHQRHAEAFRRPCMCSTPVQIWCNFLEFWSRTTNLADLRQGLSLYQVFLPTKPQMESMFVHPLQGNLRRTLNSSRLESRAALTGWPLRIPPLLICPHGCAMQGSLQDQPACMYCSNSVSLLRSYVRLPDNGFHPKLDIPIRPSLHLPKDLHLRWRF